MGERAKLRLKRIQQEKVSALVEFDPYIPISITFPQFTDRLKLYWRMVTSRSLLEVAISYPIGYLVEVTVVDCTNFEVIRSTDAVLETEGVPTFDKRLWDLTADIYDVRAHYYDINEPIVIERGTDTLRIKMFTMPPVQRVMINSEFGCEFNAKGELVSFLVTGLSDDDMNTFVETTGGGYPIT